MFFRFGAAIFLAVLVAMCGVLLEKRSLDLRREVTRQVYRTDVLLKSYSRLRLQTQKLAAPRRVIESVDDDRYRRRLQRPSSPSYPPMTTRRQGLELLELKPQPEPVHSPMGESGSGYRRIRKVD